VRARLILALQPVWTALTAIVEHIGQSVAATPRAVRFGYVFPEFEHVFASGWLTRYNRAPFAIRALRQALAELSLTDACSPNRCGLIEPQLQWPSIHTQRRPGCAQ
jgi:hypothetical protein